MARTRGLAWSVLFVIAVGCGEESPARPDGTVGDSSGGGDAAADATADSAPSSDAACGTEDNPCPEPECPQNPCNVPEDCCPDQECVGGICGGDPIGPPPCLADGEVCINSGECCGGSCERRICNPCERLSEFEPTLTMPVCDRATLTCILRCRSSIDIGDNPDARACIETCLASDGHAPVGGVGCADCFWRRYALCGGPLCMYDQNAVNCCVATRCAGDPSCIPDTCGAEMGSLMGCWYGIGDVCQELGTNLEASCFAD